MALFIHGMGSISPQRTWDAAALPNETVTADSNRLAAIEPDYSQFIDSKNIRRMSRVIKLGVGTATIALRDAKVSVPDSIITGTGYGCLEDTGTFLTKMIENKEEALNPTPFIQSTHNTIGSQIALLLQCQGYNQTYAHGAFSFESALLDALIQSEENLVNKVLVGGIDEITNTSHAIQKRFGMFRQNINGEGAAFFLVNGQRENSTTCIESVETLYKPDNSAIEGHLKSLDSNFDLILLGEQGTNELIVACEKTFPSASIGSFKHLCGEYPVASSFGVWIAATILKTGFVPESISFKSGLKPVKRILILNRYFGTHYSTISMSSC